MEFEKYQHVERYDKSDCRGLLEGTCYIFPKLDGANASVWRKNIDFPSNWEVASGSRKRDLSEKDAKDNAGFRAYVQGSAKDGLTNFFAAYPKHRIYGEWLVPHTIRTYREDAWRQFYAFDVVDPDGNYLQYDDYKPLLEEAGINYIPCIAKIKNPTDERLHEIAKNNSYLIEDEKGVGEGIVIKNYEYRNPWDRMDWGKLVLNEFKDKMAGAKTRVVTEKKACEEAIVNGYVTKPFVEKELAKIMLDNPEIQKKSLIPRLLNTVYDEFIREESYNFIKEFKRPTIDYRRLFFYTTAKVRESLPDLF